MKKALLLLFLAFSVTAFALMAFIFVGCTDDPDPDPQDDGAVDLGLTVLWASCNLGATKPEEFGGYWSSTLNDNLPDGAQYFHFYPTYYFTAYCFRYYGNTIRPVRTPAK